MSGFGKITYKNNDFYQGIQLKKVNLKIILSMDKVYLLYQEFIFLQMELSIKDHLVMMKWMEREKFTQKTLNTKVRFILLKLYLRKS